MKETITSGDGSSLSPHASSSSSCKRPQPTPIKMVARTKSASVRAKQLFEQEQALKRQQEAINNNTEENSDSDDNSSNSSSSSRISTNSPAYSISSEEILEEVCARSLMVLNKQDNVPILITDDDENSSGKGLEQIAMQSTTEEEKTMLSSSISNSSNDPKLIPDNEDERGLSEVVMIGEDEDVLKTLVALKEDYSIQEAIINQQQYTTTMDHHVASSSAAAPEDYSSSVTPIPNTPIAPVVVTEEKIIQHAQIEQKHNTIEEHPNMRNTEIGNTQHLTLPYSPNHAEQRSTTDLSDNTQQYSAASVDGQIQATAAMPSSTNAVTPSLKNSSTILSPTLPSLSQIYNNTKDGQQQHATVATPSQSSLPAYPHPQQYTVNSSPAQTYPESHYLNSYGSSSIGSTRNSPPQSPNIISGSSTPPTVLPPHPGNTYQAFSSPPPPRYHHQDTIASTPSSSPHDIYTHHYHQPPMVYHYHQPYMPPMSAASHPSHLISTAPPHVPYSPPHVIPPHHTSSSRPYPPHEHYYYHQQPINGSILPSYYSSSTPVNTSSSHHKSTSHSSASPPNEILGTPNQPSQNSSQYFQDNSKQMDSTKRKREYLKDIVSDTVKLGQLEYQSFLVEQQRRQESTTPSKKSKLFNMDYINRIDPNTISDKIEITKRKEHYADPAPKETEFLQILEGISPNSEYKYGDPLPNHIVRVSFGKYAKTATAATVRLSIFGRGLKDEPKERKFIETITNFELNVINGAAKVTFSDLYARHASHKFGKMLYLRFTLLCDGVEVSSVESEGFTTITLRGIQKRQQRQSNNKEQLNH